MSTAMITLHMARPKPKRFTAKKPMQPSPRRRHALPQRMKRQGRLSQKACIPTATVHLTRMTIERAVLLVCLPLLLGACGRPDAGGQGHQAGTGGPALVYTHYTPATELFVEFPPLVAGQPSIFAAHVTRLADFEPLTSGTLNVLLSNGDRVVARFRVQAPARPGIFTPAVTPREAGKYELTIEVADRNLQARHELGAVTVFADASQVTIDQLELPGEISYLKEQQWTNPFATVAVAQRPLRRSVPGFGTVLPPADASAEIRAPADGYLAPGNLVRAGDAVTANDPLGVIVPRLGEGGDVGELTVALERARSQQALAERDVERLDGLVAQGAVPERRLLEAREVLEVANAQLRAARARFQQYQRAGEEAGMLLRAPVTGVVVSSSARPGAYVRQGERLFLLSAPDRRWLEVRVPERFSSALGSATGAWLDVQGDAPITLDGANGARVVQTDMAIDPATRTAGVTVEYPTRIGPAAIGARFTAHVFTESPTPRLAVPRAAVIDDGGRSVVYVQTGGESFTRRPVELGIIDGAWVQVDGGVASGDRVVSEGAYLVRLAAAGGDEIGHGHAH
jgi:membrane fusion protein, heavy metal efflux system